MDANILASVADASSREVAAKRDLEAAIVEASRAGHSNRAIAAACHLSHERVRQIVNARKAPTEAELEARLSDLDARWDLFIDALTARFMPDEQTRRSEQAYRNIQNGRARRQASGKTRGGSLSGASSWKSTIRPTVTQEARRLAETFALSYLEENSSHPVCVKVIRELDEAAAIRDQLTTLRDSRVPFLHD